MEHKPSEEERKAWEEGYREWEAYKNGTLPKDSRAFQKCEEARLIAGSIMHDYLKAKGRI